MSDIKSDQVVGRVYRSDVGGPVHCVLNSSAQSLPDGTALFAESQGLKPGQLHDMREVLQECLDDIDEALRFTAEAIGRKKLRVNGEVLTPEQKAERMAGLYIKRRKVAKALGL